MAIDDTRRMIEVALLTRPFEFGGEAHKQTSITQLLEQGIISIRSRREIEIRCRELAAKTPGLTFVQLQTTGPRSNALLITFRAGSNLIEMEALPRV